MNGKEPKQPFLGKGGNNGLPSHLVTPEKGLGLTTVNTLVSTANDPGGALQHVQHSKTYQQLSKYCA